MNEDRVKSEGGKGNFNEHCSLLTVYSEVTLSYHFPFLFPLTLFFPVLPVYIILGASGSGRREILANLTADGIDGPATCFISEEEAPSDWDESLYGQSCATVLTWRHEGNRNICSEPIPSDAELVFFLTDGKANPVDQLEALQVWIEENSLAVGRILTVVDCLLIHIQPKTRPWYDACIHFTDLVLLNRRNGIPGGWIREFTGHYEKACYPCLFENVRKGRLSNPAEALYPEARRLSLIFDDLDASSVGEIGGMEDVSKLSALDDDDASSGSDIYLETLPTGRRAKPIPDIREFLGKEKGGSVVQ